MLYKIVKTEVTLTEEELNALGEANWMLIAIITMPKRFDHLPAGNRFEYTFMKPPELTIDSYVSASQ
jgi:hypothetical protein